MARCRKPRWRRGSAASSTDFALFSPNSATAAQTHLHAFRPFVLVSLCPCDRVRPGEFLATQERRMKKLFIAAFVSAAVATALAQGNSGRSPAGEPPPHVRNRAATLVGHFNDPQQMLRLAFGLQP